MATLALLVVPILHPYLRGRILWKTVALGVFIGLGVLLFNTRNFQEHFFNSGQGSISDLIAGNYKDLGRFDAWSAVWERSWQRPWLGAGVGAAYIFVPQVWTEMTHVHNDYLRVFYELGLVGLALFIVVIVWQLFDVRRQIAETDDIVQTTFSAAWLGLCAMLISCLTDNTLIYTVLYTDPLFALLGAAYGAAWYERQPATPVATIAPGRIRRNSARLNSRKPRRSALNSGRANRSPQPYSN
jgi:O-antigen ligase